MTLSEENPKYPGHGDVIAEDITLVGDVRRRNSLSAESAGCNKQREPLINIGTHVFIGKLC